MNPARKMWTVKTRDGRLIHIRDRDLASFEHWFGRLEKRGNVLEFISSEGKS